MKRILLFALAALILGSCWSFTQTASAALTIVETPYEGRLVKIASDSAVYYIGLDQKRHAFPNAKIYFSWYQDFKKVEVIDDFAMSLYPLGRNVQYRPGSRLVKISDVSEVYAIEPGGVLRNIPSEEVAIALYGEQWAKLVDDLDISFFFDYEIGGILDVIDGKPVYPRGTAVQLDGQRYIVDKTATGDFWLRPITENAWDANAFTYSEVYFIAPFWRELYDIGLPVVSAEAGYACLACEPNWSEDPNYSYTQRSSESGRYGLFLPSSWGVSFATNATDSDIVFATESLTGDGARLSVQRYSSTDGEAIDSVADTIASLADMQLGHVFANQPSTSRLGAVDVIMARPSDDPLGELVWTRIIEATDGYYTITFTSPWSLFGRYREAAHQALQTFRVDSSILD